MCPLIYLNNEPGGPSGNEYNKLRTPCLPYSWHAAWEAERHPSHLSKELQTTVDMHLPVKKISRVRQQLIAAGRVYFG